MSFVHDRGLVLKRERVRGFISSYINSFELHIHISSTYLIVHYV